MRKFRDTMVSYPLFDVCHDPWETEAGVGAYVIWGNKDGRNRMYFANYGLSKKPAQLLHMFIHEVGHFDLNFGPHLVDSDELRSYGKNVYGIAGESKSRALTNSENFAY